MKSVLLLLSDGFEEIEAISIADILRRAGIELDIANYIPESLAGQLPADMVTGCHEIEIKADISFEAAVQNDYDAVVLPGGGPNAQNLASSSEVLKLIQSYYNRGKLIAAICAAPKVFAKAGVSKGHAVTSFPGFESLFADYKTDPVVVSGNVVTSRGPGTSILFALKLAEILAGASVAEKIKKDLCFTAE
jgi:4-methyl-5(b-hydroxyethyl)-thiazole monophosphate biosynthesis